MASATLAAPRRAWPFATGLLISGAWLLVVVAQATGNAAALHHHALIEHGPPLWISVPVFLATWQVMIAAMMLPGSLRAVRVFARSTPAATRGPTVRAWGAFLGAYAIVWSVFGSMAFAGDYLLHEIVDATPWLAANPWIIGAAIIATAGLYQFAPWKQRSLSACRHPATSFVSSDDRASSAARLGFDHGLDCLGSSWALMLLMFAAGVANLWWMAALTTVMVYEAVGPHGRRAASMVGLALIGLAILMVATNTALV
jgi:predicted metal-binding membrane protein